MVGSTTAALPTSVAMPVVAFGATTTLQPFIGACASPSAFQREQIQNQRCFSQRQRKFPKRLGVSSQYAAQQPHRHKRDEQPQKPFSCESDGTSSSQSDHETRASPPHRSLASLHELTERIADLLHVGSLQDHSTRDLLCPKDAPFNGPMHQSAKYNVVIVFGKRLVSDSLTVEYGKRVVTLVKQLATGALKPTVICFAGGRRKGPTRSSVSEAAAGYLFFRSLCEEIGFDAKQYDYIIEEESTSTKENMENCLHLLRSRYGADAVANSHFTLVSSDYHLIRIQEVHRICPRHSLLFPLDVASASWHCIFAAYPFCVSPDPATAFLGRAVVLANDLSIVLVNLNGVINDRQFFARENIARLNETFGKMRDMFRIVDSIRADSHRGFRVDMRAHSETLELAIHRVREAHTLIRPLADPPSTVSRSDLVHAQALLSDAVQDMRNSLDPDRPLRIADHVDILDELTAFVQKHGGLVRANTLHINEIIDRLQHHHNEHAAEVCRTAFAPRCDQNGVNSTLRPVKRIARDGPHLILVECDSQEQQNGSVASSASAATPRMVEQSTRLSATTSAVVKTTSPEAGVACETSSGRTRRKRQPAVSSRTKGDAVKSQSRPVARRRASSKRSPVAKEVSEPSRKIQGI